MSTLLDSHRPDTPSRETLRWLVPALAALTGSWLAPWLTASAIRHPLLSPLALLAWALLLGGLYRWLSLRRPRAAAALLTPLALAWMAFILCVAWFPVALVALNYRLCPPSHPLALPCVLATYSATGLVAARHPRWSLLVYALAVAVAVAVYFFFAWYDPSAGSCGD